MSNTQTNTMDNPEDKKFQIAHLYVKHQAFDSPNLPTAFTDEKWEPKNNFEIQSHNKHVKDTLYEVVLSIKVKADCAEQRAFDCKIEQAGLFLCEGFSEDEQKYLLSGSAPNILFPYARKVLSDNITNGGFPPLTLSPMNFEAIYLNEINKQKAKQAESSFVQTNTENVTIN